MPTSVIKIKEALVLRSIDELERVLVQLQIELAEAIETQALVNTFSSKVEVKRLKLHIPLIEKRIKFVQQKNSARANQSRNKDESKSVEFQQKALLKMLTVGVKAGVLIGKQQQKPTALPYKESNLDEMVNNFPPGTLEHDLPVLLKQGKTHKEAIDIINGQNTEVEVDDSEGQEIIQELRSSSKNDEDAQRMKELVESGLTLLEAHRKILDEQREKEIGDFELTLLKSSTATSVGEDKTDAQSKQQD